MLLRVKRKARLIIRIARSELARVSAGILVLHLRRTAGTSLSRIRDADDQARLSLTRSNIHWPHLIEQQKRIKI